MSFNQPSSLILYPFLQQYYEGTIAKQHIHQVRAL